MGHESSARTDKPAMSTVLSSAHTWQVATISATRKLPLLGKATVGQSFRRLCHSMHWEGSYLLSATNSIFRSPQRRQDISCHCLTNNRSHGKQNRTALYADGCPVGVPPGITGPEARIHRRGGEAKRRAHGGELKKPTAIKQNSSRLLLFLINWNQY